MAGQSRIMVKFPPKEPYHCMNCRSTGRKHSYIEGFSSLSCSDEHNICDYCESGVCVVDRYKHTNINTYKNTYMHAIDLHVLSYIRCIIVHLCVLL